MVADIQLLSPTHALHNSNSSTERHYDDTVNPFHVLQVRQDATRHEIRQHYRRLALWHHPGRKTSIPLNPVEIQRRAHVFEILAACYETLIYYRDEYYSSLHHITYPLPLKGQVHVGGKRLAMFGCSSMEKEEDAEWVPTSTCEKKQECTQSNRNQEMYTGPMSLLYRARHYTPFLNPFTVFEQVCDGHAILEVPPQDFQSLQRSNDWEHMLQTPTAPTVWKHCTTRAKDGSIVNVTSRTLHGVLITKTTRKRVDQEGKTRIHIQVTSEPIPAHCGQKRTHMSSSGSSCCHSTIHDEETNDDDDELSLCSWPELSELSSACSWLFPESE